MPEEICTSHMQMSCGVELEERKKSFRVYVNVARMIAVSSKKECASHRFPGMFVLTSFTPLSA